MNKNVKINQSDVLEAKKKSLRKLAKAANQRMKRLEDASKAETSASYRKAQTFLNTQHAKKSRISENRFTETISTMSKMSESEIDAQIFQINKFMSSKRSTPGGINEINVKAGKKIAADRGLKVTRQQARSLGDLFGELEHQGAYSKKGGGLSSSEVVKVWESTVKGDIDSDMEDTLLNLDDVSDYETAKAVNDLLDYEVFDLQQFALEEMEELEEND